MYTRHFPWTFITVSDNPARTACGTFRNVDINIAPMELDVFTKS